MKGDVDDRRALAGYFNFGLVNFLGERDAVGMDPGRSSGTSLFRMVETLDADRLVFSEYHDTAACEAGYMLQDRRYKWMRYVT